MSESEAAVALEVNDLERRFGGVLAVHQVTFSVAAGEIFGIIGPNGAGKTTMFDLISGATPVSSGSVRLFGEDIDGLRAHQRARLGMARTFQNSQVFNQLDVRTNLEVAYMSKRPGLRSWLQRPGSRGVRFSATQCMVDWGLLAKADSLASEITAFERQRLAIAMAIVSEARILLLDEPSGGLIESEIVRLEGLIRGLREGGLTVLIIDHRMRLIMGLCDRILVLAAGRKVTLDTPRNIANSEEVRALYFGNDSHVRSLGSAL